MNEEFLKNQEVNPNWSLDRKQNLAEFYAENENATISPDNAPESFTPPAPEPLLPPSPELQTQSPPQPQAQVEKSFSKELEEFERLRNELARVETLEKEDNPVSEIDLEKTREELRKEYAEARRKMATLTKKQFYQTMNLPEGTSLTEEQKEKIDDLIFERFVVGENEACRKALKANRKKTWEDKAKYWIKMKKGLTTIGANAGANLLADLTEGAILDKNLVPNESGGEGSISDFQRNRISRINFDPAHNISYAPKSTAPEKPPSSVEQLFPDPTVLRHEVIAGDSLWKILKEILEKRS